jgi:hypothetical protein
MACTRGMFGRQGNVKVFPSSGERFEISHGEMVLSSTPIRRP